MPPFTSCAGVRDALAAACARHPDVARFETLGRSEEGRPLDGVVLGTGPRAVSLVAGAHADEPVGPETLRAFVRDALADRAASEALLAAHTFAIVPHANPDGEARNRAWMERWPDPRAYVAGAVREPPGRDVEFGYPDQRPENVAVSSFLRRHGPYAAHLSLHGMAFAEGASLLVDRRWAFRTQPLRDAFAAAVRAAGLGLHDHNRKGEKGFFHIEPGFLTTPESEAMRAFFRARGDDATARLFGRSSMEFVRSLGGDPLCVVTEIPLFTLAPDPEAPPGVPRTYLAWRERLPELRLRLERREAEDADFSGLTPVDPNTAMALQRKAIDLALRACGA